MQIRGKNVYVGLSGGVDSAVTAALLQQAGAHVTGVFIKGWYPPGMPCTWAADRRDAMRVAAKLHIPFVTLDASEEYKKGVIDYLLSEYRAGRTPNPDVMCNREVKFGAFYDYARRRGADFVATGHYVRTKDGMLLRGIDADKDQSYFLWAVPKETLAHTLFPIGECKKAHTRELAQKSHLPVADKRDSQGVCFLGSISVEDFLLSEFGATPGAAHDTKGESIGTHNGAALHTIGERIALTEAPPGPWYVIAKDMEHNTLTVAKSLREGDSSQILTLGQTNWLSDIESGEYEAQYRYHGTVVQGCYDAAQHTFTPRSLVEPIAPGQSLVLYTGEHCHGGGIIL